MCEISNFTEKVGNGDPEVSSPFSIPSYRLLWFSNLTCNTSVQIQALAASWALVSQGSSPQVVALVQSALSLPLATISIISGAVSDVVERRTVMISAQFVLAGVSIALALLSGGETISPALALLLLLLAGSSLAFNGPAFMASVGDAVPRRILPTAVIYNAVALNVARSLGAAIGGLLIALGGVTASFSVSALGAIGLIALLYNWRPQRSAVAKPESAPLFPAIRAGISFSLSSRPIRVVLIRSLAFAVLFSSLQALLPMVAHDELHGDADTFGMLMSFFGAGAVAGALASGPMRKRLSPERAVMFCTLASVTFGAVIALSKLVALTAISVAIVGGAWVMTFSIFNSSVQLASPREVGGRTLSLYQMAVALGIALGSWLGGLLASHTNSAASLLVFSLAGLCSLALSFFLPLHPYPAESEADGQT